MAAKVWFITGTSRGFGREWAIAALERGDKVVATARDTASLRDLADKYGDAVLPLALDVTARQAVFDTVARAHNHFGRLDVVVNNAGYGQFGMIEELSEQEARAQIETNLFGALWVTQASLPFLREQGGGHIVQVSSIGGISAFPNIGMYHASKWALEGLSQALAQEVAAFGIKVTMIEPGAYKTDWSSSASQATPYRPTTRSVSRPPSGVPAEWPRPVSPKRPKRPSSGWSTRSGRRCASSSEMGHSASPRLTTSPGWRPGASGSKCPSRRTVSPIRLPRRIGEGEMRGPTATGTPAPANRRPPLGRYPRRSSNVPGMGVIGRLERHAGQALLGATFMKLGFDAAVHPGPRVDKAAALGLPNAELAVRGNGAAMVAGGAALTLDKMPRLAAFGLIVSMIPTTLAGHAFWDFDGAERKAHEIQFLKNAGLVGGLLVVLTRRRSA
jgi:NAD(P)-dependent dehydrogenase (short-subunit alcohol dehydrogenase family)/uncharacterized membrane protein YphA (DoxX/SURF4 family)